MTFYYTQNMVFKYHTSSMIIYNVDFKFLVKQKIYLFLIYYNLYQIYLFNCAFSILISLSLSLNSLRYCISVSFELVNSSLSSSCDFLRASFAFFSLSYRF